MAGLARAGLGELAARRGLGPAKAARLAAAIELGRRVAATAARQTDARFPSSAAVDGWARPRLASLDHEELWALVLDGHQGLRAARRVARGGLHGLHVAVRDPLRLVLREGGSAFVLVHNHPSGEPAPSAEDVRFTEEVARAADVVGVPLLDHVIVARSGYASLLDQGSSRGAAPPLRTEPSRRALGVAASGWQCRTYPHRMARQVARGSRGKRSVQRASTCAAPRDASRARTRVEPAPWTGATSARRSSHRGRGSPRAPLWFPGKARVRRGRTRRAGTRAVRRTTRGPLCSRSRRSLRRAIGRADRSTLGASPRAPTRRGDRSRTGPRARPPPSRAAR